MLWPSGTPGVWTLSCCWTYGRAAASGTQFPSSLQGSPRGGSATAQPPNRAHGPWHHAVVRTPDLPPCHQPARSLPSLLRSHAACSCCLHGSPPTSHTARVFSAGARCPHGGRTTEAVRGPSLGHAGASGTGPRRQHIPGTRGRFRSSFSFRVGKCLGTDGAGPRSSDSPLLFAHVGIWSGAPVAGVS